MTIKNSIHLLSTSDKRPRFGIIEIYSHYVFVHTLALVAQKCGMEVTIYTSARLYKDMVPLFEGAHDEFKWVVSEQGESDFHFMRRIRNSINSEIDLLCCNSVQGWRIILFWLFKFNVPTMAAAGRISEFFGIKYKALGFPTLRKFLHHNFTRFFLQKCLPRYQALITHTSQATEFSREHGFTEPLIQMPFSIYKENVVYSEDKKCLHCVITGSIQAFCRDHIGTLNVFESLWDAGYSKLKLTVLAGTKSAEGQALLRRMERLKSKGYNINYFSGWIEDAEFSKVASDADIFLSPLNLNYYSCGELTSGIVEAVRQAKPGIYPDGYLPDKTIETSSLFYKSLDDLKDIFESLISDDNKMKELSLLAIANSEKYSLAEVAKDFSSQIREIL